LKKYIASYLYFAAILWSNYDQFSIELMPVEKYKCKETLLTWDRFDNG